jgi:hypothetical protein
MIAILCSDAERLCPVVYSKRAVNAWGLVQAGLRTQNDPLSRPHIGWSSLHATPHGGVVTQLAAMEALKITVTWHPDNPLKIQGSIPVGIDNNASG